MGIFEILLSPAGMAFLGSLGSLGSFAISIFPYIKSNNQFTALRKNVASVTKLKLAKSEYKKIIRSKEKDNEYYWVKLEEWLADAELMLGEVKTKILSRSLFILFVFIGIIAGISFDGHNYFLPEFTGALESHDFILFVFGCFVNFLLVNKRKVLSREEAELIREFNKLRQFHYSKVIQPKISELLFNLQFLMRDDMKDVFLELDQLREFTNKILDKIQTLENKTGDPDL